MMLTPIGKKAGTILAVLALAGGGFYYWRLAIYPYETTDNAYLKAHNVVVAPRQGGYVKQVLFTDNQTVNTGDLLVVIDDRDYQARAAQAEAQVKLQRARIATLEADKLAQNAKIQQETASQLSQKAGLERAAKDQRRYGNLAREGAVSVQTHDHAATELEQAQAEYDKAGYALREAQTRLTALDAQIAETKAQLQAAEANLKLTNIDLADTRVLAPISGIIGNSSVQVGQLLTPGAAISYLIPARGVYVEANFKETQLNGMRSGQEVEMQIDAYPDQIFHGVIDSFSPASGSEFSLLPPENASGNFTKIVRRVPVKISFKDVLDFNQLLPGLSAEIKIRVRQ